jgi:hypothetical protein
MTKYGSLTLQQVYNHKDEIEYKVVKTKNTISYTIGQVLTAAEVLHLYPRYEYTVEEAKK